MSVRRFAFIAAAAAALGNGLPLLAQCQMCRTALGALGSAAADAFNRAILILLIPAVGLFCGVFLLMFRHRDPTGGDRPER